MLKNASFLPKVVIVLIIIGLGAIFVGSFSYRLSNPSLVKRVGASGPRSSDFGNQSGMGAGMNQEMMVHISDLMVKLKENPDDFNVRLELAEHFMDAGDWSSALVHIAHAQNIKPENIAANYYRGVSEYSLGNFAKSAEAFEKLLNYEKDPSAMFNLAILYYQHLDKANEAKEIFTELATSKEDFDQAIKSKSQEILNSWEQLNNNK